MCTIVAGYAVKFLFFVFDWDRDYSPDSWFALDLQHFMLGAVGALFFTAIHIHPATRTTIWMYKTRLSFSLLY